MVKPSSRCRILFLTPSLRGGGAERVILSLAKHLDRGVFHVSLGVVNLHGAMYLPQIPEDVGLFDLACSRVRYAMPKIISLICDLQPDLVFSTLGHLNLALALAKPFLPKNVKIIGRETTVISSRIMELPLPSLWERAYKRFFPRFDFLVCQSCAMMNDFVHYFGFPRKKVGVINNPVDVREIKQKVGECDLSILRSQVPKNCVHFVASGRFVSVKGFDLLMDALARAGDTPWVLSLLGEGPLEGQLKAQSVSRGLQERIFFRGFLKNPYPWYAIADAFILSSRVEGFPNVVLEALACGTPVIATPAVGGTREIVEKIAECELAAKVSSEALATAILRWVGRRPGRVSESVVKPYSVELILEKYQDLFLRVVGEDASFRAAGNLSLNLAKVGKC